MSTEKVKKKKSKFTKFVRASIRILARAHDFYTLSVTGGAGELSNGSAASFPAPYIPSLPRSFSTNSNFSSNSDQVQDDNINPKLKRFASARNSTVKPEWRSSPSPLPVPVPRSKSVAIKRIDEHEPCGDEMPLMRVTGVFARSRSCAVSNRSNLV